MEILTMEKFKKTLNMQSLENVFKLVFEYQKSDYGEEIELDLIPHYENVNNNVFSFKKLISKFNPLKKQWIYILFLTVNDKEFKIEDASFKNVLVIAKDIINHQNNK